MNIEIYLIISILAIVAIAILTFLIGKKVGGGSKTLMESRIAELNNKNSQHEATISRQNDTITALTSERDVQKTKAEDSARQLVEKDDLRNKEKEQFERNLSENDKKHEKQLAEQKNLYEKQIEDLKKSLKDSFDNQLAAAKESSDKQIAVLKEMNKQQVEDQLNLIKNQMQTTSENILKARQEELENRNKEQVSKIIDPLQESLKAMKEAIETSKKDRADQIARLDQTIKVNMEKSTSLGETADRLSRALTGEVKVQGNFGELKLKQLLQDLELKEGEQFDTQATLMDKYSKAAKGDDGKGLIPDFILHFPNNRHVVVDSKMSLTDYEKYINAPDGSPEKSQFLQAHLASVRVQVKRLAKKEYSKYLPEGYNRLNFAIMYIPIEGALNLALYNDTTLWRDAYDVGVMILGPQTMYMNLRVLEMMWTQVRQLDNQQAMITAANTIIERVQDFGMRFADVEKSFTNLHTSIERLKITTADKGQSIITAARKLLRAGATENKRKKSLAELDNSTFIDDDQTQMLTADYSYQNADENVEVADDEQPTEQ